MTPAGVDVGVGVGVGVAVAVAVAVGGGDVGVGVDVADGGEVGVRVGVDVAPGGEVGVCVGVEVADAGEVGVCVGVGVDDAPGVEVGVAGTDVGVAGTFGVDVRVTVGVGVGVTTTGSVGDLFSQAVTKTTETTARPANRTRALRKTPAPRDTPFGHRSSPSFTRHLLDRSDRIPRNGLRCRPSHGGDTSPADARRQQHRCQREAGRGREPSAKGGAATGPSGTSPRAASRRGRAPSSPPRASASSAFRGRGGRRRARTA